MIAKCRWARRSAFYRVRVENSKLDDMKYLLTLWTKEIDANDTGDETFEVLGEFPDLASAQAYQSADMDRLIAEQLRGRAGWRLIDQRQSYMGLTDLRGLKDNTVVADHQYFRIGDGSYENSISASLILIELPPDAVVDENLFDLLHCDYVIKPFFEKLRKQ
jgi:hypothetical protein